MQGWIEQINILRPKSFFRPIILALLQDQSSQDEKIQLLKKIERHEFLVFALVNSRSDANQAHFYAQANRFFGGHITIYRLTDDTRTKTGRFYNQDKFLEYVNELFNEGNRRQGDDRRGFPAWPHLNYFLIEYENFLRLSVSEQVLVRGKTISLEPVYPQSLERDASWNRHFDDVYTGERCNKLCNSLGNLVLLSRPRTGRETEHSSFADKKRHPQPANPNEETGYFNGSHSEREIAAFEVWRHKEILERGVKMLGFMSMRLEISLAEEKRQTLTMVNFQNQNEVDD